jgi:hypothetical protein
MPTGGEAGGLGKKKDAMTEKLSAYDRGYSSFLFPRVVSRVDPAWK